VQNSVSGGVVVDMDCDPHGRVEFIYLDSRDFQMEKAKDLCRALRQIINSCNSRHPDLPRADEFLHELIELHGGCDGFVAEWHKQLVAARESKPGSKFVLDCYRDIVRLWLRINTMQTAKFNIEQMDEEETRDYLANILLGELAKRDVKALEDLFVDDEDQDFGDGDNDFEGGEDASEHQSSE
jgi:hypothetical protein